MAWILFAGVLPVGSLRAQAVSTSSQAGPEPFTFRERMRWVAKTSISPKRLTGYAISSAISTASNAPPEYGPHWDGYAKRVGMRMSTGATGLMIESSIGYVWGEDPRYYRASGQPVRNRLWNVVKMSFLARNQDGHLMPAYARYISIPANSFLSNAWRADSHATNERAVSRIQLGFVDRMIGNAFSEFWPEIIKVIHKHPQEMEASRSDSTR